MSTANVTNELIYEILKRMQGDIAQLKTDVSDLKADTIQIRSTIHVMQGDIMNLKIQVNSLDRRVERIERRLDIHELAEPESPVYDAGDGTDADTIGKRATA